MSQCNKKHIENKLDELFKEAGFFTRISCYQALSSINVIMTKGQTYKNVASLVILSS